MTKLNKNDYNNLEMGDIIKINFSPSKGHEQKGYRPGLVISDPITQKELNGIVTVVPITNIKTKGNILMDQIKVLDLSEREYEFIEKIPKEILKKCNVIFNAIYEKLLEL